MPLGKSNGELADTFADYFIKKITKLHDSLDKIPKYQPTTTCTENLAEFPALQEEEVLKVISSMPSKSCEIDSVPASLLKQSILHLIPVITKMVNLSLEQGIFAKQWKLP